MLSLAAALQENVTLREQLAELTAKFNQVLASNAALTASVAQLNDRVGELLAAAQRKQRPPPAEKPAAPPPVVDGDARLAFEGRPRPPEKPAQKKERTKRPSPTGRKALPAHLEAEEHALRPDVCAHCGSDELDAK